MRSGFFVLILVFSTSVWAREVVDATGSKIQLPESPARVVTLAPSLGELAADLLGPQLDKIVGVTEYTDEPAALRQVKSVGPYSKVSLETVVSLKPDLVLATLDGNAKDQIDHLRELKIPVVVVATGDFKEVGNSMELVGRALGVEAEGVRMRKQFETGIERIRARTQARKSAHPKVLLQVGSDPLVVVGRGTFLQTALETIGASNTYGDSRTNYPRPSVEDVVSRNPEVIVVLMLGRDARPFRAMAESWKTFPSIRAVQSSQVKVLVGDPVVRPTLRLLEGLSLLEKAVHGS